MLYNVHMAYPPSVPTWLADIMAYPSQARKSGAFPSGSSNTPNPPPSRVAPRAPKEGPTELRTPVNGITCSFARQLESQTCWHEHASEYDVELETLTIPDSRTYSTDHLTARPTPSVSESPDHNGYQPSDDLARYGQEPKTQHEANERIDVASLNYKPTALRWPFSVSLLSVMAGLFAFLEYQAQHLLPTNYALLEVSHPTALGNPGDDPQPPVDGPQHVSATITSWGRNKLVPVPDPSPDPRPPEQSYPKPFTPFDAYCGWAAPTWSVETYTTYSTPCATQPQPDNLECLAGEISVWLYEIIETFVTEDPSWCPCRIVSPIIFQGERWNEGPGLPAHSYYLDWDTADTGCKSAMLAIASLNEYKIWRERKTTSTIHTRGAAFSSWSKTGIAYPKTPPPLTSDVGIAPLWMYPTTDAKGHIMIPLVSRAAGIDPRDVFGNDVQPTETALFPQRWRPMEWQSSLQGYPMWVDNTCWSSQPCTLTPEVTDLSATVWWTFPLFMPDRLASSTGNGSSQPPASTTPTTTGTGMLSTGSSGPDSSQPSPPATIALPPSRTSSSMITTTKTKSTHTSHENHQSAGSLLHSTPRQVPASATTGSASHAGSSSQHFTSLSEPGFVSTGQKSPPSPAPEPTSTSKQTGSSREPESTSVHHSLSPESHTTHDASGDTHMSDGILALGSHTTSLELPSLTNTGSRTFTRTGSDVLLLPVTRGSSGPHSFHKSTERMTSDPIQSVVRTSSLSGQSSDASFPYSRPSRVGHQVSNNNKIENIKTNTRLYQRPSANQNETITATSSSDLPPTPSPPPLHPNGPISPGTQSLFFNLGSESAYLMVSVVPVLLATFLLVLLQVMTNAINAILPYRALNRPQGALAEDSLSLSRNPSILSLAFIAVRFWSRFKDPLPVLSLCLTLFATVLVSLSSEVVRLVLTTNCEEDHHNTGTSGTITWHPGGTRVCAFGLRKSNLLRAAEGILGCLAVLVIVVGVLMWWWKSGLADDPWSIGGTASMVNVDGELVSLLRSVSVEAKGQTVSAGMERALEGRRFRLGPIHSSTTREGHRASYGIDVVPTSTEDNVPIKQTAQDPPTRKPLEDSERKTTRELCRRLRSVDWDLTLRVSALLFTLGLLILILYYETTVGVDTAFERFMNSQTVGVRILFAVFGILINGFWNYYFASTSTTQIHTLLSSNPLPAAKSILLSPPSNIFIGLFRSTHHIKQAPLSFNISLATFFAKFAPILLSNIPFSFAVTWKIHEACTWISVGLLSHMVLVLTFATLLIPLWERISSRRRAYSVYRRKMSIKEMMPLRADSIAGCMYYVFDSAMVKDFEGLSVKGHKERGKLVAGMERLYWFGNRRRAVAFGGNANVKARERVAVDYI